MAVMPAVLQPGITLTGSSASIFDALGSTVLTQALFANPTAANVSVTVAIQRSGGGNLVIIPPLSIAAGGTLNASQLYNLAFNSGDQLWASGSGITAVLSGYTVS